MNEITYIGRDLFGPIPDRSPDHIPPTEARNVIGSASLHLRFAAVNHPRGLEIAALADVLDALNEGATEDACQAAQEAEALRRMRA